jgi:hypothetical protein
LLGMGGSGMVGRWVYFNGTARGDGFAGAGGGCFGGEKGGGDGADFCE